LSAGEKAKAMHLLTGFLTRFLLSSSTPHLLVRHFFLPIPTSGEPSPIGWEVESKRLSGFAS
jgi:hypothetical protein